MDTLGTALGTGYHRGDRRGQRPRSTGELDTGLAVGFVVSILVGVGGLAISGGLKRVRATRPAGDATRSPGPSAPPAAG